MDELAKIRGDLDRSFDYQRASEDALLAQRRRTKELESVYTEQRAGNAALPAHLRG